MLKKIKKNGDVFVDIDNAIAVYENNNPGKKITRDEITKEFDCKYQTLVNYQNGRVPWAVKFIHDLMEKTGASFEQIVKLKTKQNEKN